MTISGIRMIWAMIPIIALAFCDRYLEDSGKSNSFTATAQWLLLGTAVTLIFCYGLADNIGYSNLQKKYERTYAYCVRLLDRIEQTEGYYQGIPVALIGVIGDEEFPTTDLTTKVTGNMIGLSGDVLLYTGDNYESFIKNYLGATLNVVDVETMGEIYYTDEYVSMDSFPGPNSTKVVNGILYVKTENIIPFDQLERICDGELREMSRGYLLNSWYNYWSSVLIENLFRRNPNVLPALGKIKNVDFFVDDFPFDLKVTHIPNEYAAIIRKRVGVEDPMKLLKVYARRHGIVTTSDATPEQLRYEIVERMKDSKNPEAQSVLDAIDAGWRKIVECIMAEKGALIRWLYENQGDMRFGTENRVFLILIDMLNPDDSWKLKRNVDMISPLISNWVSGFKKRKANDYLVEFSYKSRCYETYADIIFVIKKDY